MIYLHSGRPGAGKTLAAVERGIAWVKEGRRVYALGVNGLNYAATGIQEFPDSLENWSQVLKPTDVLIVDEVQRQLPKGLTMRFVPPWVEELTRNRHHGIDMLWTSQDPRNVDSFVRRLVNEHRHFVNKWGKDKAKVYTWPDGVEEPDSTSEKSRADVSEWVYPKEIFPLYTSAQFHTRKPTTPRAIKIFRVSMALALVLLVVGALVVKYWFMSPRTDRPKAAFVADKGLSGSLGLSEDRRKPLSTEEWLARITPRVEGLMWTAPLYDDRHALSEPETYCMLSEDRHCSCITEQGTKVKIGFDQCKAIVENGVYNPYRKPLQDRPQWRSREDERAAPITVQSEPVQRSSPAAGDLQTPPGTGGMGYGPSAAGKARP